MTVVRGVENPGVVDIVSHHPVSGLWTLTMVELRPWGTEHEQYRQLQSKANNYIAYVESGQLVRDYPEAEGAAVELHLSSADTLPKFAADFVDRLAAVVLRETGMCFRVTVQERE